MPAREEVLWRQKSRIVAKKEDKNTNLFIKWSMLVKKNYLTIIMRNGETLSNQIDIKEGVANVFHKN